VLRVDSGAATSHAARVKIYLVRHAEAVSAGLDRTDAHRHLSASGRSTCRGVGRLLREAEVSFDVVLTSPLVRAVQTAELVSEGVGYLGVIEAHVGLSPGAQPEVIAGELLARDGAVAVFGHEPSISALAAYLSGRPSFASFLPGQVCYLDSHQPVWKLNPDALQIQDLH
jgi:phosphohistidine phosphatase